MANAINLRYRGDAEYAPHLLRALGVSRPLAYLATQQLFMTPSSTDPDAQATMITVQALQRGLGLVPNGIMNTETVNALTQLAGVGWMNKTWGQLAGRVVSGSMENTDDRSMGLPSFETPSAVSGLEILDTPFFKTVAIVGGLAALYLTFKRVKL